MKLKFDGEEFIDKLQKLSGIKTIRELAREFDDLIPSGKSVSDPVKNWEAKIGRWKNGQYPSTDDLVALAKLYKCSVDYLLGLDDAEPESNNPKYDFLVAAEQLMVQGDIDLVVYRNTETVYNDASNPFSDDFDPDKPDSEPTKIRVFRPALVIRDNALCYYIDNIEQIKKLHPQERDRLLGELLKKIRFRKPDGVETPSTIYQWLDDFQKRYE